MLPNHRLLARAFHRVPAQVASISKAKATSPPHSNSLGARRFSNSSSNAKWEGGKPQDHIARETDDHNVHHDAAKEGKAERASGEGSSATSEKGGELNKKAEKDHKEAPRPVIGMNDERGGKGH